MNRSICWLTLDMNRRDGQCSVSLGQGETGRTLKFRLYENGKPYTILEGYHVIISGVMDNNHDGVSEYVIYNDCYIQDGVVCYDITDATALGTVGVMNCQLQIVNVDSGCVFVCSPKFQIVVHSAVYDKETVESSEQFFALQKLVGEFGEAIRLIRLKRPLSPLQENVGKRLTVNHWHYLVINVNAVPFDLGVRFVSENGFGNGYCRIHADGEYTISIQKDGRVTVKDHGVDVTNHSNVKVYSADLSLD